MRIAVVGSGISGLAAAWLLSRRHEVHLFERDSRLGGHTHTVAHPHGGRELALDTGFIVFNERTYPNLCRVFAELGVATRASDMSFSVSCREPDLEYASHSVNGLFARRAALLSTSHLRMLVDIVRFGRLGRRLLAGPGDPAATVAGLLAAGRFGEDFADCYLLPMTAAIWSSGTGPAADFPRDPLLRFLDNHGLLAVSGQPQWRTVVGGSRSYIAPMVAALGDRVHLGRTVARVVRSGSEAAVALHDGSVHPFDHVVIATHADQALAMLAEPSPLERELLGAWRYSSNDTWLHTDASLMPRRRAAWASWNYLLEDRRRPQERVCVSYHLNRLQGLAEDREYVVTLNPPREPAPASVIRRLSYRHPVYSRASVATQAELPRLNGSRRTHFCGSYFGNGFHEDGLNAAIAVAEDLGVSF
jgi:predicted NAD/FAD-binding protein